MISSLDSFIFNNKFSRSFGLEIILTLSWGNAKSNRSPSSQFQLRVDRRIGIWFLKVAYPCCEYNGNSLANAFLASKKRALWLVVLK